jgi:hypothetical protein
MAHRTPQRVRAAVCVGVSWEAFPVVDHFAKVAMIEFGANEFSNREEKSASRRSGLLKPKLRFVEWNAFGTFRLLSSAREYLQMAELPVIAVASMGMRSEGECLTCATEFGTRFFSLASSSGFIWSGWANR